MLLVSVALVMFFIGMACQFCEAKYKGKYTFHGIGATVNYYWRTSRELPAVFYTAAILCVWWEICDLPPAKAIAVLVLFFSAFSLMLCMIMGVVKLLFLLLNMGEMRHAWRILQSNFRDWKVYYWRKEKADICASVVVTSFEIVLYGVLLTEMARTTVVLFTN